MIEDIEINQNIECVYELNNLDLPNCFLIKTLEGMYIESPDAIFSFNSIKDFMVSENSISLKNEDNDIFNLQHWQFQILSELIIDL